MKIHEKTTLQRLSKQDFPFHLHKHIVNINRRKTKTTSASSHRLIWWGKRMIFKRDALILYITSGLSGPSLLMLWIW